MMTRMYYSRQRCTVEAKQIESQADIDFYAHQSGSLTAKQKKRIKIGDYLMPYDWNVVGDSEPQIVWSHLTRKRFEELYMPKEQP